MNEESASADVALIRRPFYSLAWRVLLLAILAGTGYALGRPRGLDHGYATETRVAADEKYDLRTYDVGDITSLCEVDWSWSGSSWVAQPVDGYDRIENLIMCMIEPIEWDIVGGDGRIDTNEEKQSVVVYQTPHVHNQIAELFAQLREVARANNLELTWPATVEPDNSGSDVEKPQ